MILSQKLKYARERAGLTGSQVKDQTGIGESSVSEFENDKREPSLSQLEALAKAYHRSIAFFLSPDPLPIERILWRLRPSEGAEHVEVQFIRLCEQYRNLEVWTGDQLTLRLPTAVGNPSSFDYPQAEELAKRIHRELGLGDRPAPALLQILEEACGVKVFHLDFQPTGTAACAMSDNFGAAILLNSQNARWRRNHDVAHELFHLLTWKIFRTGSQEKAIEPDLREEKLATCFARHLLMPVDAVRTAINSRIKGDKIDFEELFDIAREFDVSVESLLWHLHFLYRRPETKTKEDIERAKAMSPTLEERVDGPAPGWPARYHALAVKALRHAEISVGRFAEYLGISRSEAMKYVKQESSDEGEMQIALA